MADFNEKKRITMIQRVQSVYFLIAAIVVMLPYFFPIASFVSGEFIYQLFACHVKSPDADVSMFNVIPMALLTFASFVISVVALFLFKNRKLQMKVGRLGVIVLLSVMGLEVFYYLSMQTQLATIGQIGFGAAIPLLSLIFVLLAIRGVKKDEALIRSADRIR